jgi:hypothetical protein
MTSNEMNLLCFVAVELVHGSPVPEDLPAGLSAAFHNEVNTMKETAGLEEAITKMDKGIAKTHMTWALGMKKLQDSWRKK